MTASESGQTGSDAARSQMETLFNASWTVGAVVRFHSVHKLLLLAHSPEAYRELGRLVADARRVSRDDFEAQYASRFTAALRSQPTRRGHVNALQHAAGYFTRRLDRAAKAVLSAAIEDYRRQRVPLVVPMTLLRQHAYEHAVSYLADQAYLSPRSG